MVRGWFGTGTLLAAFLLGAPVYALTTERGSQGAKEIDSISTFIEHHGISTAALAVIVAVGVYVLIQMLPAWKDESRRRAAAWDRIAAAHEKLPELHVVTHERIAALADKVEDLTDEIRRAR